MTYYNKFRKAIKNLMRMIFKSNSQDADKKLKSNKGKKKKVKQA